MDISDKIYKIREDNNLSQEQLAYKLNITRQAVSKWETKQSVPDYEKMVNIANMFNISIDSLLDDNLEITFNEKNIVDNEKKLNNIANILSKISIVSSTIFLIIVLLIVINQKVLINGLGLDTSFYFPISTVIYYITTIIINIILNINLIKNKNVIMNIVIYIISLSLLFTIEKIVSTITKFSLDIELLTSLTVVTNSISRFYILYIVAIFLFFVSSIIRIIKNKYIN